jgi:hypothetical protein
VPGAFLSLRQSLNSSPWNSEACLHSHMTALSSFFRFQMDHVHVHMYASTKQWNSEVLMCSPCLQSPFSVQFPLEFCGLLLSVEQQCQGVKSRKLPTKVFVLCVRFVVVDEHGDEKPLEEMDGFLIECFSPPQIENHTDKTSDCCDLLVTAHDQIETDFSHCAIEKKKGESAI